MITTEVYKNIFKGSIALPKSPLKALNVYLIKGGKRNLLIDTGFNIEESHTALLAFLDEMDSPLCKTDIFLTHLHVDHTGLAYKLKNEHNQIFVSQKDGQIISDTVANTFWDSMINIKNSMGFPADDDIHFKNHPAALYGMEAIPSFTYVKEGDMICYGYEFQAISLAGHTPGQMGLYSANEKILFSGDHILKTITPNLQLWDLETDYLDYYLSNLLKVKYLNLNKIFVAHREDVVDIESRIDELFYHHIKRLNAITALVEEGYRTVYDITRNVKWDFGDGNFLNFPMQQKWFASSEVLAHLMHLVQKGKLRLTTKDSIYYYNVKS